MPLLDEMREKRTIEFKTEAWGLRDIPLDETVCSHERIEVRKVPAGLQADPYAPVTAIRPEFNADRPFRVALRHLEAERAQIYAWNVEAMKWAEGEKARAESAEAQVLLEQPNGVRGLEGINPSVS